MKKPRACSVFAVQYVPNPVSGERVNIGILLHSPEENYLRSLFTTDFKQVRHLHPHADLEFLSGLQEEFERQIEEHKSDLDGYLRYIQDTYSNLIQVSRLCTCLLSDPTAAIRRLLQLHVG